MAGYRIEVSEGAKIDLSFYTAFERKIILTGVRRQLAQHPKTETINCKMLRDNPIASWELRVGRYRVFYEADDGTQTVVILAVGHKAHNTLFIRGREVRL